MKQPIPDAALDDRLGFVGNAGGGKTYNALGREERILELGGRIIHVDPLGVAYGLRIEADGRRPSPYRVVIFGGSHGDLPLTEHAGPLIGETVARMAESCILDLSQIGTKAGERRFMLGFVTALYRQASGQPVHLVLDEADMWAPQKLLDKEGEAAKLLGMVETIVRRGRVKGFIPWLISQRPAVISKDVLSQVDGLVVMKLTSSQDRDAIEGWIEGQADKGEWKAIRASLPTLERGKGVVWIPGRGILETVQFPPKRTFDSSRTPKRGEAVQSAVLQPIDIGALKAKISTIEAETKANDPKALRARIAELERNAKANVSFPPPDPKAIEEADKRGFLRGISEHQRQLVPMFSALENAWRDYQRAGDGLSLAIKRVIDTVSVDLGYLAPERHEPVRSPAPKGNGVALPRPQQRILNSLAFWRSIGIVDPSREQVAAVAGYAPGSGNFNNLIGALRGLGYIDIPRPGALSISGVSPVEIMSKEDARSMMMSVLSGPQQKIVRGMFGWEEMTREKVAEEAGYAVGSGNFNNLVGSLCSIGVLTKPSQGMLELSGWAAELLLRN